MGKPSFKTLWANYPHESADGVFKLIGWDDLAGKPGWENTCAIRISICLARSGVSITSAANMKALKGSIRGKQIELRQDKLSNTLKKLWGEPIALKPSEGLDKIAGKDGVVSFWKIGGYSVGGQLGGHIDLIDGSIVEERNWWGQVTTRRATYEIAHGDYMSRAESIWFWEMPA